jgi:hypothetical protein
MWTDMKSSSILQMSHSPHQEVSHLPSSSHRGKFLLCSDTSKSAELKKKKQKLKWPEKNIVRGKCSSQISVTEIINLKGRKVSLGTWFQ